MSTVITLLKPHLSSYKNRLLPPKRSRRGLSREAFVLIALVCGAVALYYVNISSIEEFKRFVDFDLSLAANFLRICVLSFFILVFFSSTIVSLSSLYMSSTMPLLITAPVSSLTLYLAKLVEITLISGWVCLFFSFPLFLALYVNLDLPFSFFLSGILLFLPLLLIPSALALILVTLFVNIIPPHRIREVMIIITLLIAGYLLALDQETHRYMSTREQAIGEFLSYLGQSHSMEPRWSPTQWVSNILEGIILQSAQPFWYDLALIALTTIGVLALGFLVFDSWFMRGLSINAEGNKTAPIYNNEISTLLARILIPFNPQLRALACKEAKMFLRDSTQSLQLMMLLLLTFVYLFNFRSLYQASDTHENLAIWWQILLSLANISFGTCVLAAIATRFVYPSMSLEGRAFVNLVVSPMTIERLLFYKFLIWLLPVTIICLVLLLSGTLALDGSKEALYTTSVLSLAISIGVTGLGIGVGAYYAKFDWDSPAQVTTNFGSLIYMLLALGVIGLTLIPAAFLFMLACVPSFAEQLPAPDYVVGVTGSILLIFIINCLAARRAIHAGAEHLRHSY